MPDKFSYEGLFATGVPEVTPGKTRHAKYDFAVAYPDPDTLPLDGLADAVRSVLSREGRDLAYYTDPGGYLPLRQLVAGRLARSRGMQVDPEGLVLTGGSGEAISMVIQALTDPGDTVLTEEFLYLGTLRQVRRGRHHSRGPGRDNRAAQERRPEGQIPVHHPDVPEPFGLDHDPGAAQESAGGYPAARGAGL